MEEFKRIMVPVDGSSQSNMAFDKALGLAKLIDGSITVVNVIENIKPVLGGAPMDEKAEEIEAKDLLDEYKKRGDESSVKVNEVIRKGEPAREIIKMSDDFDLIIIGSFGIGKIASLVLGSTAEEVTHKACCPVMVIRKSTSECGKGKK